MYHSYPSSSPYLLPTGPPGPPTNNTLPSLSGFDRINQVAAHGGPSATVPSAAVTPPVNSPQSPNQRLPPVNGIPLEPKIEKNLEIASNNPPSCDAYGQPLQAQPPAPPQPQPTASSAVSTATAVPANASPNSRPGSAYQQPQIQPRRDSDGQQDEQAKVEDRTSRKVEVYKYYERDAGTAVEEHFKRALDWANSNNREGAPTPMNQRGLPNSFWQQSTANHLNGSTHSATSTSSVSTTSYADFYSDQLQQAAAAGLHPYAQEWGNFLSAHPAQTGYVNRSAQHYTNYSRFHQASATPFGWPSRLVGTQVKGEWSAADYQAAAALQGATGLHNAASDLSHYSTAAAAAAYSNMTGLETSLQDTTSKESMYWPSSF